MAWLLKSQEGGNSLRLMAGMAGASIPTAETATFIANAITIRNRSISEMAPEAVIFAVDPDTLTTPLGISGPSGSDEYDARLAEPIFVFSFGDSYAFTSSTNTATLTSATALGPVAQHTYRSAGTYNVRVDIYKPGGGHWYATSTVTVNAWTGTTITVGPSGRDYTSFDTAMTNALGSESGQTRIVLDRGETFTFSGKTLGDTTGNRYNNLTIMAASGAGADPIVNWNGQIGINESASALGDGAKDLIIQNIDARGQYDSTAGTGTLTEFLHVLTPTRSPNQILIDGGSVQGMDYGIYLSNSTDLATHVILNDTDWGDYAFATVNAHWFMGLVVTGSRLASHPEARINTVAGNNGGWLLRAHTPLIVLNKSDFHCRQGWAGSPIDYQGIRLNSDGRTGAEMYVSQNFSEAGYSAYSFGATNSANAAASKAVVFESNILLGSYNSDSMMTSKCGGSHIRNNLCVLPSTVYEQRNVGNVFSFEGGGPSENLNAPIRIYNNTFFNYRDTGSTQMYNTGSTLTDIVASNNIMSQPNLGTPDDADAPLITSGALLMQPVELGIRNQDGTYPHGTDAETPQNIVFSFAPDTGSAAIDDATTGLVAPLDQTGALRGATPSRGWREPA